MANNYYQGTVSPFLPLTQVQRDALDVREREFDEPENELTEGEKLAAEWAAKYDLEWGTGLQYAAKGDLFYLYCEEGLEGEAEKLLQEILRGLPEDEYPCITYEAAYTCSKMRQGEFGGSAAFITRDSIEWVSTSSWLQQHADALEGK